MLPCLPPSPLPCFSRGFSSWTGCESGASKALGRVAGWLVNTAKAAAGGGVRLLFVPASWNQGTAMSGRARQPGQQWETQLEGQMALYLEHGGPQLMGESSLPCHSQVHHTHWWPSAGLLAQAQGAGGCWLLLACFLPQHYVWLPKGAPPPEQLCAEPPWAWAAQRRGCRPASLWSTLPIKHPVCSSFPVTSRKKFKYKDTGASGAQQAYCTLGSS